MPYMIAQMFLKPKYNLECIKSHPFIKGHFLVGRYTFNIFLNKYWTIRTKFKGHSFI